MEIDDLALPGGVILDGDYERSFIHFVGMTLNVDFGGGKRKTLEASPESS